MKIQDNQGNEIEVYTQEELEKKLEEATTSASEEAAKAAIEKYKEENPDQTEKVSKLQKDLEDANKKLEEAGGGEEEKEGDTEQVKRLRRERDEATKALQEFQENTDSKIEGLRKDLIGDAKDEIVAALAMGDEDLKKKILSEYDSFKDNPTTRSAIKEQMDKAYRIVTGSTPTPGVLDNLGGGGGYKGSHQHHTSDKNGYQDNDNRKAMRTAFGISEEDIKKHGDKVPGNL